MAAPTYHVVGADPLTITRYYGITAEGGRIGIAQCVRCGAALLLGDPDFDGVLRHHEWHRERGEG